jgi:hypothetical protein
VLTRDLGIKHVTGRVGLGNMRLNEMFSPIGAPKDDDNEIDWLGDLKFFMDNDNHMLSQYLFPVVKKHSQHLNNPNAYRLYLKPINTALNTYCEQFKIENKKDKFPEEALEELAKRMCEEQKKFIENGDYEIK